MCRFLFIKAFFTQFRTVIQSFQSITATKNAEPRQVHECILLTATNMPVFPLLKTTNFVTDFAFPFSFVQIKR